MEFIHQTRMGTNIQRRIYYMNLLEKENDETH